MCGRDGGAGGRQILKSTRMVSLEMRSEPVIVLLLAARLGLCLHYLHENRENNRVISVGGGGRRILKSARMLPREMRSKTVLALI